MTTALDDEYFCGIDGHVLNPLSSQTDAPEIEDIEWAKRMSGHFSCPSQLLKSGDKNTFRDAQ
jgi:hypothetical protein